jgi:hypothetical protein
LSVQAGANLRSQGRSNVFLAASMIVGTTSLPVRVRNLSTRGAFVDGASLPVAGSSVRLVRGALSIDGAIAWAAHGHAGLRFIGAIDVAEWVKRVGHPGQERVDNAIVSLRRNGRRASAPASPTLGWVSAELDSICERVAASTTLTVELGEELLRLDAVARTLQKLAARS